jgi:HlyD family secretion protein
MNTKSLTIAAMLLIVASCAERKGEYDASGVFETTEITVSAEGNGKITSFTIEEGDRVNAGDTLGCIDTVQLHLTKLQLEANIRAIGSGRYNVTNQIASLERQISKQKQELARFTKLAAAGAAGTKQTEDIQSQIDVLEKQLAAQKETLLNANSGVSGKVAALEAQVAQIDDQIRKCVIVSPADGTVLAKYAEEGELASQGRPLFKVADVDNIKLRAYITAVQLTELKLGQKMKVFADSGEKGRKEYDGTLVWISEVAEFTPKTIQTRDERANLVYPVKIAVKNDGLIKLGMYGEVKF